MEIIIPWQFNGFCAGFESMGWMIMFLGGREMVKQEMLKQEIDFAEGEVR